MNSKPTKNLARKNDKLLGRPISMKVHSKGSMVINLATAEKINVALSSKSNIKPMTDFALIERAIIDNRCSGKKE